MYQLPKALPDELLLSRLIRFITISGISSSEFLQTCFGSKRISLHPFLTSGINNIAKLCNEDANVLFNLQTLAPLFSFYLPMHAQSLRKKMLSNNGAKAFRASQLTLFGSGKSTRLKSCSACTEEDIRKFGVAYWHRCHQVPGIDTCSQHGNYLASVALTMRQRIIPSLLPKAIVVSQRSTSFEIRVAKFATELLDILSHAVEIPCITDVYLRSLQEKGYLTACGRVRRKALMLAFSGYIKGQICSHPSLTPSGVNDFRYISQLLERSGSHHPFKHLLFSSWLFDEAQQVFNGAMNSYSITSDIAVDKRKNNSEVENECLDLLRAGNSLAAVARKTGKSRCFLKRIAMLNNVRLSLKPKILTDDVINKICLLAYLGFHRREISKRTGVGIGSIEQTISGRIGLTARRKKCRFESSRRRNRVTLIRYLEHHQNAIRKDVKRFCNAAFFWLYLNDRKWLESHLPEPCAPKTRY